MPRVLVALLALTLLAGCSSPAGDDTDDLATAPEPEPYAPPPPPSAGSVLVGVGDSWRYLAEDGTNNTVRITGAQNGTLRVVSTTDGPNAKIVTTVLDQRTLALISLEDSSFGVDITFVPPLPIIIPAEDHRYTGKVLVDTFLGRVEQPANATITFYGLENVSTPAGEFETYHYAATLRSQGTFPFEQTRELWFSPEVRQAVRLVTDGRAEDLVSYELLD